MKKGIYMDSLKAKRKYVSAYLILFYIQHDFIWMNAK